MDILAPILAYLTCVAGIVGAFVLSVFVVFSTPERPAVAQHSAAVASVSPLKTAALADAKKPAVKNEQADKPAINYVANTQNREPAPQAVTAEAASQKLAVIDARQKTKISRAQWRQIVQQERIRRLAYQQGSDFETRFLGYAD
jgi:hypothetical protein